MEYSVRELADMHFIYGRANGNGLLAKRLYVQKYPNRRAPSHRIFARIHQRLRETGSFEPRNQDRGRNLTVRTPDVEERILAHVEEDPGISVRRIAARENVSRHSVWMTLHTQLLYPYHIQRVQALAPADYPARVIFCRWLLRKLVQEPLFWQMFYARMKLGLQEMEFSITIIHIIGPMKTLMLLWKVDTKFDSQLTFGREFLAIDLLDHFFYP